MQPRAPPALFPALASLPRWENSASPCRLPTLTRSAHLAHQTTSILHPFGLPDHLCSLCLNLAYGLLLHIRILAPPGSQSESQA